MKVVIIAPALITGGAETMVARLATAIDRTQVDVEVVCTCPRKGTILEKKIQGAGIPLHFINNRERSKIRLVWDMLCLLSKIKPDVIHSHIAATLYALPWVLLHKTKLVHTIHTRPDMEFSTAMTAVLRIAAKLRKVILVAVSKENHAIAKKFYCVPDAQVRYVNNPVETEKYYRKKDRNDDRLVFINVSRQDINKNQILAVRAMAEVIQHIPNARLMLVGDGNQHEKLIQERDRLGLADVIELPGEIAEPEHLLAAADVYLSTSHREGLPLSMLEAMASGLPVISTNVGGVSDIVRDNGVLIDADDQTALVREMLRFATDLDLRTRCGVRSLEIAKEYDAKTCANAYVEIYWDAVNK